MWHAISARRLLGPSAIALIISVSGVVPSQAFAAAPDRIEQLEPANGEWQLQYDTQMLGGGQDEHTKQFELSRGITRRLAVGLELEAVRSGGKLTVEGVGLTAQLNLTGKDDALQIGVIGTVEIDKRKSLAGIETMLVAAKSSGGWRRAVNLIFRHSRDDDDGGQQLAYAWSIERRLSENLWLGFEGSGQALHLSTDASSPGPRHFVGPTLMIEREMAGAEIELGVAYFHGLARDARVGSLQLVTQLTF